jgi:hypothetical protein
MKHHVGNVFLIDLLVDRDSGYWDDDDVAYISGSIESRPSEFNLHLALYLLKQEHFPFEQLERLELWVRDNKLKGGLKW